MANITTDKKSDGSIVQTSDAGKDEIHEALKGYPNYRGYNVNEGILTVYVMKKIELMALAADEVIPAQVLGYTTKVVQVGDLSTKFLTPTAQGLKDRIRPVPGNVSLGNKNITAGTCGGILIDEDTGYEGWATNTHVACPSIRLDLSQQSTLDVVQPGVAHGGRYPDDYIGKTRKAFIMPPGQPAFNDFAYIERDNPALVAAYSALMKEKTGFELPVGIDSLKVGDPVFTITAMLEYREGTVLSLSDVFTISYGPDGDQKHNACISFTAISIGGSSGGWIYKMTPVGPKLVAYLFAGSSERTIGHEIQNALTASSTHPKTMAPGTVEPSYVVFGTIVNMQNVPIQNVIVNALTEKGSSVAVTDSTGRFSFIYKTAATVTVNISVAGFKDIEYKVEVNENSKSVDLGAITLVPKTDDDVPEPEIYELQATLNIGPFRFPITGTMKK